MLTAIAAADGGDNSDRLSRFRRQSPGENARPLHRSGKSLTQSSESHEMSNSTSIIPRTPGPTIKPKSKPIESQIDEPPEAIESPTTRASVDDFEARSRPGVPDDLLSPENIGRLRQSQNFSQLTPTRAVLSSIPIRKPGRHEWVRIRSGADWEFNTYVFRDREVNEDYLVSPSLLTELSNEVIPVCLVLFQSRSTAVPCVWALRVPDSEKPNRWHLSAIDCAELARSRWTRVASDSAAGMYISHVTDADLPQPTWDPELAMDDYVRLAFKGRVIASSDHPVLRRLRGEI